MRERVCGNCGYFEKSHHPDHRCIAFDALCVCGHGESVHADGGCSAVLKEGFCSCPGFMSYYPLQGRVDRYAETCSSPVRSISGNNEQAVNHPSHYGGEENPYEVIKVLAAWLTFEEMRGFCIGNAIKYLGRAGKKGNAIEDWSKARWYLDYAINMGEKP